MVRCTRDSLFSCCACAKVAKQDNGRIPYPDLHRMTPGELMRRHRELDVNYGIAQAHLRHKCLEQDVVITLEEIEKGTSASYERQNQELRARIIALEREQEDGKSVRIGKADSCKCPVRFDEITETAMLKEQNQKLEEAMKRLREKHEHEVDMLRFRSSRMQQLSNEWKRQLSVLKFDASEIARQGEKMIAAREDERQKMLHAVAEQQARMRAAFLQERNEKLAKDGENGRKRMQEEKTRLNSAFEGTVKKRCADMEANFKHRFDQASKEHAQQLVSNGNPHLSRATDANQMLQAELRDTQRELQISKTGVAYLVTRLRQEPDQARASMILNGMESAVKHSMTRSTASPPATDGTSATFVNGLPFSMPTPAASSPARSQQAVQASHGRKRTMSEAGGGDEVPGNPRPVKQQYMGIQGMASQLPIDLTTSPVNRPAVLQQPRTRKPGPAATTPRKVQQSPPRLVPAQPPRQQSLTPAPQHAQLAASMGRPPLSSPALSAAALTTPQRPMVTPYQVYQHHPMSNSVHTPQQQYSCIPHAQQPQPQYSVHSHSPLSSTSSATTAWPQVPSTATGFPMPAHIPQQQQYLAPPPPHLQLRSSLAPASTLQRPQTLGPHQVYQASQMPSPAPGLQGQHYSPSTVYTQPATSMYQPPTMVPGYLNMPPATQNTEDVGQVGSGGSDEYANDMAQWLIMFDDPDMPL